MSHLVALTARDAACADLEEFLASDEIEPRHYRACLLGLLGKREQAQAAFLGLLEHDPKHFGVLNDFGTFLFSAGLRKAAAVALAEAVKWHPENALGHTNLACIYVAEGEMEAARRHFEIALGLDPASPMAHEGLAVVLRRQGDEEAAKTHRAIVVVKQKAIRPLRYTGNRVTVLLVESAIGGNIFAHDLLDDPAFEKKQVFLEFLGDGVPLPEHDLVFNAIGDAERCANVLGAAPHVFARTPAPIVNAVSAVVKTTRCEIAARLSGFDGVITPRVYNLPREQLTG
ncbi:MAG: tetratricopeptide repeat protein, partial [Polyangiaceae bacterium]